MRKLVLSIAIATGVVLVALGGVFLMRTLLNREAVPAIPPATQTAVQGIQIPRESPEDVIASRLREYSISSEVRGKAISILKEYAGRSGTVLRGSYKVGAGSSTRIELTLYRDVIYELTVSVSGNCIGSCDIGLELLDSSFKLAYVYASSGLQFIKGRYSYLRMNFTLYWLEEEGTYYLRLDNSYSIFTSKYVHVTLRAYYPSYVIDDDYFKIFAIGHWVSNNIRYVKDPHGFEYIAPPTETLRVGAGDCDDFAVLLAVLYRSVGLNSSVGLIDTDGDGRIDHATALVYLSKSSSDVARGISKWASALGIRIKGIAYFNYGRGILLIVDPPMSGSYDSPWSVEHTPYRLVKVVTP